MVAWRDIFECCMTIDDLVSLLSEKHDIPKGYEFGEVKVKGNNIKFTFIEECPNRIITQ